MKIFALILAGLMVTASAAFPAEPPANAGIQGITKPSHDVIVSFTHPGRVAEVLVKDGDTVKKDQLVAKQDDTEEQAEVAVAESQAEDVTRITAQKKVRDQKERVYIRKRDSGAVGPTEVEEALLDFEVGVFNVVLSEFEHTQDIRKLKKDQATLEKTRLYSPIDGVVEQTLVKTGENVDTQNMKVMRIVNINPLWVEVPVPFSLARTLRNTDSAKVVFTNKEARTGKVIHVASVADAASDTVLVRVEVENAAKTPAGERVNVSFNPTAKVAADDGHQ